MKSFDMVSQKMIATGSSRPIRGTFLLLLFLASYYLGNPFSHRTHSYDDSSKSWRSWISPAEQVERAFHNGIESLSTIHEGGPRIRQATMIYQTDKYNVVYERAVDSHLRHGERWGVPTHILRHDIVEAGYFNKPAYLLGLIINELAKPYGKRSDWLVWFDADTILLNTAVPWNLFIPPPEFDDVHLLATKDQNGFNAGMFMIRIHEWSVKMLSEVIALRQFQPSLQLPYYDQSAIEWVCNRTGYEEHFIYQTHNWWNSFGIQGHPFATDRFMLHYAGVDCCGNGEPKGTAMTRWLDKIETNPNAYYTPLENLTLPAEVSEYWGTLIKARKTLEKASGWSMQDLNYEKDLEAAGLALRHSIMKEADDLTKIDAGITRMENIMANADNIAEIKN